MRRLAITLLFALTVVSLPQSAASGEKSTGLHTSVNKHRGTAVKQDQIEKLRKFDQLIRYFANFSYIVPRHKVNADFLRALILAESGANPRAVSPRDALGLAQIIYPTGKKAASDLANSATTFRYVSRETLRNLQREDLFDPAVNILLASYLIARYNHRFDGRLELVLSAWNAGENTDSLNYGRHAPYRETENLIGRVNAYYIYLLQNRIFP